METDYIERIKKLKSEKKITTETLSARTGIPVGTLSKMLAGISDSVKLSYIVSICDVFDVSLDYIVSGVPDNDNNYTLSPSEIRMIEDFRTLDSYGRDLVSTVISKERERAAGSSVQGGRRFSGIQKENIIIPAAPGRRYSDCDAGNRERRSIPLFDNPVSAGTGVFLDGETSEKISVPNIGSGQRADFALRINGDSMEPRYRNGDVLLVERTDSVEVGEPSVFVLNGCGYFKIFGGSFLHSLNELYGDIPLNDFDEVNCVGRVIGKLKKK